MIWFTSDTHFGHENVLRFCERPWKTVEAMNKALIDRINACVAPDDTLYHLGDFSFRITVEEALALRKQIEHFLHRLLIKDMVFVFEHVIPAHVRACAAFLHQVIAAIARGS